MTYAKRINGYTNYLLYKKVLEKFGQGDCGRREIAKHTGLSINSSLHLIRLLKKENVIKLKSFSMDPDGTKRMIYTLFIKKPI